MKGAPWLLAGPGTLEIGRTLDLDPSEVRHLTGPLRRRPGDQIVLTDGHGTVAEATIVRIARGRAEVEITRAKREPEPDSDGVTVALAIVSGQRMDWAVQKSVEVGVRRVVPIETELVQRRRDDIGPRIAHWRRISRQVLKQCRRPWEMEVGDVVPLTELVESWPVGGIVSDRDGCAISELPDDAGNLLVVGPEGGFTAAESELFDRRNWPRLRLGRHNLRSETAAVVGGAMLVVRFEGKS